MAYDKQSARILAKKYSNQYSTFYAGEEQKFK